MECSGRATRARRSGFELGIWGLDLDLGFDLGFEFGIWDFDLGFGIWEWLELGIWILGFARVNQPALGIV